MRRVRAVLSLLAAVAVLAGCYRTDMAIHVDDDGSGSFEIVFAIDREAWERFGGSGLLFDEETGEDFGDDPCGQIRAQIESSAEEVPAGTEVKPYEQDGFCGVQMRGEFSSIDQLDELLIDADDGTFSTFTLERDGDAWVFEAEPLPTEDAGEMVGFEELMQGASNVFRLRLPGRQVDHNADRIDDDGTLIWNLGVTGETRTLRARTEPGDPIRGQTLTPAGEDIPGQLGGDGDDDGGSSALWIGLGLLVVVAAVVGLVLWQRTRTKTPPVVAAPPAAAGGPAAVDPTAPYAPQGSPTVPPAPGAPAAPTAPAEPPVAQERPAAPSAPSRSSAPTAPQAPSSGPQWDPQRGAYIQWDPVGNRWLQYDDAGKEWKPIA